MDPDVRFPASSSELHYIGRFDTSDPSAPSFSFAGSAIHVRFRGTSISAELETNGSDGFAVVVDGAAPKVIKPALGRGMNVLASNLTNGVHDVSLHKRTESVVGVATFFGVVVRGALVSSPYPFAHRIEFVGDSITCGYGNEARGPACHFSPDTENEFGAWGAIAARQLNAAHTSIAYSGKGVVRNSGGTTTELMKEVFLRTHGTLAEPRWDFSRYTPDVVVINLGTNDYGMGDPGTSFSDGYLDLLRLVRSKYPSAWIVCSLGTMMPEEQLRTARKYIQSALEKSKDARTSFLDLGVQDFADGVGCDMHPSLTTHQKMGTALAKHIREKLSW